MTFTLEGRKNLSWSSKPILPRWLERGCPSGRGTGEGPGGIWTVCQERHRTGGPAFWEGGPGRSRGCCQELLWWSGWEETTRHLWGGQGGMDHVIKDVQAGGFLPSGPAPFLLFPLPCCADRLRPFIRARGTLSTKHLPPCCEHIFLDYGACQH